MKNIIINFIVYILLCLGYAAFWLLVKMGVEFDEIAQDTQETRDCQEIPAR